MAEDSSAHIVAKKPHKLMLGWFNVAALGVLLVLATGGLLYYAYVSDKTAYLKERNFRLLSSWSQQITDILANYKRIFESAAKAGHAKAGQTKLCVETIENVLTLSTKLQDLDVTCFVDQPNETEHSPMGYDIHGPLQSLDSALLLHYVGTIVSDKKESDDARETRDKLTQQNLYEVLNRLEIKASLSLKDLIDQVGMGKEGIFDFVLLANHQGKIVAQGGTSAFLIPDLTRLFLTTTPSEIDGNRGAGESLSNPGQKLKGTDTDLVAQLPLIKEVKIGDTDFQLFAQLIKIPSNELGDDWILAGLVESSKFRGETFTISYTVLLLILFVVLFLLLGLPMFKLWTMGPRDRLKLADVLVLMGVSLAGTALLTFFLLDTWAYLRISDQKDRELELFAEAIQTNFQTELDQVLHVLNTFNISKELRENNSDENPSKLRNNIIENLPHLFTKIPEQPFPDLMMAFWMDKTGQQQIKWTVEETPTPLIDVRNRPYFQKVLKKDLLTHSNENGVHRFWVQPIRSWTTGEFSVIVSTPTPVDVFEKLPVSAIEARFRSLINPVVPSGFGYAIINDRDGGVLFHSQQNRALREIFFEETDWNPELQARVYGRVSDHVSGNYWGVGHRFYVKPMKDMPWSLVVYRNKEPLRTFLFEVLVVSGSLFFVYVLILWSILLVILVWRSAHMGRGEWMWPQGDSKGRYQFLIGVNGSLTLALIAYWLVGTFSPRCLLLLGICFPALSVVFMYCTLKAKANGQESSWQPTSPKHDHRSSYAWMVMTFMLVFAFVPAFAVFTVAHDAEMELLVKHGQFELARAVEQRQQKLFERSKNVKIAWPECLITGEDESSIVKIYGCFLFNTKNMTMKWITDRKNAAERETTNNQGSVASTIGSERSLWEEWLRLGSNEIWTRARVLYNNESRATAGLIQGSEEGDFIWKNQDSFSLVMKHGDLEIVSTIPKLRWPYTDPFSWQFWVFLLLVGLVSTLFGWILYRFPRFISEKVFLLDFTPPLRWNVEDSQHFFNSGHDQRRNLLLLGVPGAGKSLFVQREGWQVIDLHEIGKQENWRWTTPVRDALHADEEKVVAVDHFEYMAGSPAHDFKKLQLLEGLLATRKRLCVLSSVNPMSPVFRPGIEGSNSDQGVNSYQTLWIQVFQSFVSVYYGPSENLANFWPTDITDKDFEKLYLLHRKVMPEPPKEKKYLSDELGDLSCPYYRTIWASCSNEEKLALYHLAKDRFLHSENPELRPLLQKGLIVLNQDLRLLNESFRQFVLATGQEEQILLLEKQGSPSSWRMTSGPLGVAVFMLALFLLITQDQLRSGLSSTVALLPALLPVLIRLFGVLQRGKD